MKSILVIDDEPAHRLMVRAVMEDAGWRVTEADSAEAGLKALTASSPENGAQVVLLDVGLPGMSGHDLLPLIRKERPTVPVVMLTAYGTVGSAVEAMKNGAFDYLTKPADNDELVTVAEKALAQANLLRENTRLRNEIAGGDPLAALVGNGSAMRRVHTFVRQAGPSEGTVLILGESGTGKELIADALHAVSPRAPHAMVKVNCAALPAHLLESELFGYAKGAFTGAVKDKPGRFQLADKGTLFLDEIAEMPLELQAKLLRALQERVVEPLGSVKPVPVDVRIIAAANKDLAALAASGSFREDLFFRLNVLEIVAPPLRDRLEDLPALASALLARLCEKNRRDIRGISPEAMTLLSHYRWPGNVRELENSLERAVILSRSDIITPEALPDTIRAARPEYAVSPASYPPPAGAPSPVAPPHTPETPEQKTVGGSAPITPPVHTPPASPLDAAEREALVAALNAHGGHREKTADSLGISRRTLQYKLKKYGLTREN